MKSIFKLGVFQKLQVIKHVPMGVYMSLPETLRNSSEAKELILLPKREVPEGTEVNDLLNVFVYRDSKDRLIATTITPYITFGEFAYLTVTSVTNIGAFLDWGLIKELFLPFKEQTYRVRKGDKILVSLYIDKSDRLCATMHLYGLLLNNSPYSENDTVNATIYELSDNFGAFAAVDNKYSALIPKNELYRTLHVGEQIEARVKSVTEDGRLTLSLRKKAHLQIDINRRIIMEHLNAHGGYLPFGDKSSPESIRREFQMSKAEFKRAIGRLYKEGSIIIKENGIYINAD